MSKPQHQKLLIKNMVCPRCLSSVEEILLKQKIAFDTLKLGEVDLVKPLGSKDRLLLKEALEAKGFELIENRLNGLIEKIKLLIHEYLNLDAQHKKIKLSTYLVKQIPYDYSYLSDLFSSVEGHTIEHYFIAQRIEKVKELLVYGQLNLSEIAFQTGFSSVHHLSAQFKKLSGLSPSYFKKIGANKRKALTR
jgi:AraC-like DNA-binding protein